MKALAEAVGDKLWVVVFCGYNSMSRNTGRHRLHLQLEPQPPATYGRPAPRTWIFTLDIHVESTCTSSGPRWSGVATAIHFDAATPALETRALGAVGSRS